MLDMEEMQNMQRRLQERYAGWWEPVDPAHGLNKLMWMIAEAGGQRRFSNARVRRA